jgi:hypothetical protein
LTIEHAWWQPPKKISAQRKKKIFPTTIPDLQRNVVGIEREVFVGIYMRSVG